MSKLLNELIGYNVQSTAEWRRQKAKEFPRDTRNIQAAEELDRLAAQIDELNGSEIERQIDRVHESLIRDGWEDVWQEISEAISSELRSIGFHYNYTVTEFLEWYRDLLDETLRQKEKECQANV